MSVKKKASNKKITRQTISISPALKDWITRHVNKKAKMQPNDERYKSVSAFYNYVLENVMNLLESGKTLDDLKNYADGTMVTFYDKYSFRATIPYYEVAVQPNKYDISFYDNMTDFFLALKEFYIQIPRDVDDLMLKHERFRNYAISNKLTKEYNFEEIERGIPSKFKLEYIGTYQNLHFENCKMIAAIYGYVGLKITDCLYNEKSKYCRYYFEDTDLAYQSEIATSERLKLIQHNLSFFVNHERIINDEKEYHLWMKLAEDKECVVKFNIDKTRDYWIDMFLKDIEKFGKKENFLLNILKIFEKLHWISIENDEELIFNINLSNEHSKEEIDYLKEFLSQYAELQHLKENKINLIPKN